MVNFQKGVVIAGLSLVMIFGVIGCPKKPATTASQSIQSAPEIAPQPSGPPAEIVPKEQPSVAEKEVTKPAESVLTNETGLKDIYFDFDKSTIRSDMKDALERDVNWLKANLNAKVQIEGHCDERGTDEYNLALGEKRAHAVKQFLISEGINASRLSTISYGKEKPVCNDHDETCYKLNRRAHFTLLR